MRAAKEDPVLRRRIETRALDIRRRRDTLGPDLARIMAAVELAKDYDPEQARDELGRWTSAGAAGAAAGFTAETAAADAFSVYGTQSVAGLSALAQRALAGIAALLPEGPAAVGAAAAGSAVVLGTLFLSLNRDSVATGTLPDASDFSYKYDQDTGLLTVTRQNEDGTTGTVFSGPHDNDAVFRDENGNAIGRYLGDSVAIDAMPFAVTKHDVVPMHKRRQARLSKAPRQRAAIQKSVLIQDRINPVGKILETLPIRCTSSSRSTARL
jgi:hypothetical protein